MQKRNKIIAIVLSIIIIGSLSFGIVLFLSIAQNRSPSARYSPAMVYDEGIQKIVLFGGGYQDETNTEYYSDTWIYDYLNNNWKLISTNNRPSARTGHSMVYDSVNQIVILFGGFDENIGLMNDIWIFDSRSNQWTELLLENNPTNRSSHSMFYDPINQKTIIFGGYRQSGGYLDDTWAFDYSNNTWTELNPLTNPQGRYGHQMVYDSDLQKGILFGGRATWILDDTWTYDYVNNTWTELSTINKPDTRYWHGMVYDSTNQKVAVFGGRHAGALGEAIDDTWIFDPLDNTWTEVFPDNPPSHRMDFSMVYDSDNQKTILFGGFRFPGNTLGDSWVYNYNENSWSILN